MNHKTRLFILVAFALLALVACAEETGAPSTNNADAAAEDATEHDHSQHEHSQHAQPSESGSVVDDLLDNPVQTRFVCPMHPQIVQDEPGTCPICGMNLVQREQQGGGNTTVRVHPAVQQAMNLRTAEAKFGRLFRRISAQGTLEVDQSALAHLHPRTEGWIGELDVAAVGEPVQAGQRLFTLYATELVNVQDEFLQAVRSGNENLIRATRRRLEVLDVQPGVIDQIREAGEPLTYVPWYAERDGYVSALNIRAGMYVQPGLDMIEIADPAQVWLIADVFGAQIDWVSSGQPVRIGLVSQPGDTLRGRVDLVYPELAPKTRTARARIVLDNPEGELKIGDWASLFILAGPKNDIVYVPTEAIIRTGQEERVIVQDDSETFSVRVIHSGLESGEFTEIIHGLDEGDRVVVSGQFLIDSEASINAGHNRLTSHDHE